MKELKIGDKVEVLIGSKWKERIFIKFGKESGVMCLIDGDEAAFNNDDTFKTVFWDKWRFIEEPEYHPFTRDDDWVNALKGKWIKSKIEHGSVFMITNYNTKMLSFNTLSFDDLFNDFLFDDGSIIGVKE